MKLNQIIALEKGIKNQTHSMMSEFYKLVQKPALFAGFAKTYQRRDEESEELPAEQKKVEQTVPAVLQHVQATLEDLLAITARKEWSNTQASADIIVNGTVLATAVPVTFLLFLEKQLTDLRTFAGSVPTLDITEDWLVDPNTGMYKTAPVQTHRTKKVQRALVLYPATPEHPAQTQLITEDVVAGYWATIKYSGAMPLPQQQDLVARIETLLRAVKAAREAANNGEEVSVPAISGILLGYLFPRA